jgi:hypothetical protein
MYESDASSICGRTTPSTGDWTTPNRSDRVTGVSSGNPQLIGGLTLIRTTAKATLSHYQSGLLAADHEWKIGTQLEKGEHFQPQVILEGSGSPTTTGNRIRPFRPLPLTPVDNSSRLLGSRAMP